MDRSIYPEGVEVHQDDLARTESDRAFHILQRHLDTSIMGAVTSGDIVTVNGTDGTLVDVARLNTDAALRTSAVIVTTLLGSVIL